jgi:hypothetical protein
MYLYLTLFHTQTHTRAHTHTHTIFLYFNKEIDWRAGLIYWWAGMNILRKTTRAMRTCLYNNYNNNNNNTYYDRLSARRYVMKHQSSRLPPLRPVSMFSSMFVFFSLPTCAGFRTTRITLRALFSCFIWPVDDGALSANLGFAVFFCR